MARQEAPPFDRGTTFSGIGGSPVSNEGFNIIGKEWVFEDTRYGTNQYVYCRAVVNSGPFALLPGRLAAFDPNYPMNALNGYVANQYQMGLVVDELLPPAGVAPNDVFWAIVQGPCLVLTPLDGGADNVIAWGDPLASIAAATTGATSAGRVATALTSGATTSTRDSELNIIGRALSAKTTGQTGSQLLVNIKRLI